MLPTEGCRVCDSPPWSAAAAAGLGWWIVCLVHCKKGVSACLVCKCWTAFLFSHPPALCLRGAEIFSSS